MEFNIMDNNKLIILIFIVLLLLSLCAEYASKIFAAYKLKYIEEIFGPEGFITVDNKMKGE
jgi:hypothetical protein